MDFLVTMIMEMPRKKKGRSDGAASGFRCRRRDAAFTSQEVLGRSGARNTKRRDTLRGSQRMRQRDAVGRTSCAVHYGSDRAFVKLQPSLRANWLRDRGVRMVGHACETLDRAGSGSD